MEFLIEAAADRDGTLQHYASKHIVDVIDMLKAHLGLTDKRLARRRAMDDLPICSMSSA